MAEPSAGRDRAPLSFAQQRLWFLQQLDPADAAYNVTIAVEIRGRVDVAALRHAAASITIRHDELRTVFRAVAGRPVQECVPRPSAMRFVDLARLPSDVVADALRRLLEGTARRPFDLAAVPPAGWILLRLAAQRYVLVLAAHHIVFDGGSLAVVARELEALYGAYRAGHPARLDTPAVRYADFARAERGHGGAGDAELEYWRKKLAGAPPRLTVFPAPAHRTAGGRPVAVHLAIDRDRVAELRDLARRRGCTVYTLVTAALARLLQRYSGHDDIVIGSPVSTRDDPGLNGVVGMFVNLLPLRIDLSGDLSFDGVVARVRDTIFDAFDHRSVPFERIVEELRPVRTPTLSPFFQVQLVHQRLPAAPCLAETTTRLLTIPPAAAKYELSVTVTEGATAIDIDIEADPGRCDQPALAAFADHFECLLNRSSPTESSADIVSCGVGEVRPRRAGVGVHGLATERATCVPDSVAVAAPGGVHLTYRGLATWAAELAARLRHLGVGVECRVGVLVERSVTLPAVLAGVLQAGAAFVPLDPDDPPDRLAWMVADAGVGVAVASEGLADRVPAAVRRLVIDAAGRFLDGASSGGPAASPGAVDSDGEQAAYVMYTSGSTGRPKGVVVPHRGIANRLLWMQEEFGLQPGDRVLHKTPVTFDVSLWELLWPLLAGGCVVVARPGGHRDAGYLADLIAREQVTVAHFVPSMLSLFVEEVAARDARLPALDRVVCSGEALPGRLAERFGSVLDARLDNLYGPTEASVDVTWWHWNGGPVVIGWPIANVAVHVLDDGLRTLPAGIAGEICIGGSALARGYLSRPALTALTFVPDPYGPPGARLYRTGDRARRRVDGAIDYLGRRDHQIKLAGNRIELGEVEETLRHHPAVAESAAVVEGEEPNRRLVAYVVPRRGSQCSRDELVAFLRTRLAAAMVPAVIMAIESMPHTATGKLDRKALPAPSATDFGAASHHVHPPRGRLERTVAEAWCAVLGLANVGSHQNFFDIGGNSLLLLDVHERLRRSLDPRLTVLELFRCPTVASLAEFVAQRPDPRQAVPATADRARRRVEALAASRSRRGRRHDR